MKSSRRRQAGERAGRVQKEFKTFRAVIETLEQRTMLSAVPYLTPAEIRAAYGFSQTFFTSGGKTVSATGAGQTIAIVDAYGDPNIASDLTNFDATFGIANTDSSGRFVLSTYVPSSGVAISPSWALETSLDVEWAHAIAPQADIVLVEAKSSSMTDLMSAVDFAKSLNGVVAVSMSWGGSEFSGEQSLDSNFTTPTGHLDSNGLAGGITFIAASGDAGTQSYPATSPNVLSVGGTVLSADSSGNYLGETAWSDSGGGPSSIEHTNSPDVSYNAGTGYLVYDSLPYNGSAGWWSVGGTSAGAPQWAGLIALADQGRALRGLGSLNGTTQTLPTISSLPESDFHDITSGSNGHYSAGVGYDLVTGKGSPIAPKVIAALVGGSVTTSSTGTPFVSTATATTTATTSTSSSTSSTSTRSTGASRTLLYGDQQPVYAYAAGADDSSGWNDDPLKKHGDEGWAG